MKLQKNELSKKPVHLRLTRRGRNGPITLVEVLNSRGYPAVLRPVQNSEAIPIYMEGLMAAQPYTEKTPETTSVEFLYNDQTLAELRARDRNGSVLWRLIYDREVAEGSQAMFGARYVNSRGFNAASRSAATHIKLERDSHGRDVKITFFDATGEPTPNGEAVFGYKIERNGAGRAIHLLNLGRDGKPAANRAGVIAAAYVWDSNGRITRVDLRDGEGKSAPLNGVAAATTEYDAAGNATRTSRLGEDGKLARTTGNNWVVQENAFNERGEVVGRKYFKGGADGATSLSFEWIYAYDEFGHPADIRLAGEDSWRTAFRHDASGNVIEEKYLDAEGRPVAGETGFAIKKRAYEFGPQGSKWIETYFAAGGAKTYGTGGYHRMITEFGATGVLQRSLFEEFDPALYSYYRIVVAAEYDAQGRLRRNVTRYEDDKGQLAAKAGLKYTISEETFDQNGRVFLEWQLGCHPDTGAPVSSFDTEYHRTGARKRRTRQACDENRKPLPFTSNGNSARSEQEFDQLERRERIYDSGFDETRVGFATREAKFSGDTLQSVIHKRSDGSVVDRVLVFINAITPSADQPKVAELRVGDQLVAANDKPVLNGYDFVFSNFPGGPIEVLRDGTKLRIDGFNAGQLGIVLEDRAR
jgi:hypothetical protein